jgi:hypothetical protein
MSRGETPFDPRAKPFDDDLRASGGARDELSAEHVARDRDPRRKALARR